jgi:hypothetical protein
MCTTSNLNPADPVFANPRSASHAVPMRSYLRRIPALSSLNGAHSNSFTQRPIQFYRASNWIVAMQNKISNMWASRSLLTATAFLHFWQTYIAWYVSCSTRFGIRTDGNGQDHVPGCHCETRSHCPGIPTRASTSRHRHDAEATLSAHRCLLPICPHEILNPPNESSADRVSK